MSDSVLEHKALTRRNFLKATTGAAGVVAMSGLAACQPSTNGPAEDNTSSEVAEEIYRSTCMGNCSGWGCILDVVVREGKVCDIRKPDLLTPDGQPNPYQDICLKGYTNIERLYAPDRILYPMRQTGERGSDNWERITWDEAIKEITTKWKAIQSEYGKEGVIFMSGTGNSGAAAGYADRLRVLMGASLISQAYDNAGSMALGAHCGWGVTYGQNELRDLPNAEVVFVWGTNPTEAQPIDFHFLTSAMENGAKVVTIDPVFTTTAAKSDKFVPIRPGTDALLAIGMCQIAIKDGKEDALNLKKATVAPLLVKDSDGKYLRLSDLGKAKAGAEDDSILVWQNGEAVPMTMGSDPEIRGHFEVEGIKVQPAYQILLDRIYEWDMDTISEYTDISTETIQELTDIYTSGRAMIYCGFGPDHFANCVTAYYGMLALMDVTGQENKKGAGLCATDYSTAHAIGIMPGTKAGLDGFSAGRTVYAPHFAELMDTGKTGTMEFTPRALFSYKGNPIGNQPNRQSWLNSFMKMDFIVVADMFMCETASYADIVLPVSFLFEQTDLMSSFSPYIRYNERVVPEMGESKCDFDIVTMLGKAMGFEQYFTQTVDEFLEAASTNDTAASMGVTWEKLNEEHRVWAYPVEPVVVGETHQPITPTGRLEFYWEDATPQESYITEFDFNKERCLYWEPPAEAWYKNEKATKYPLCFISERDKFKTHTMFGSVSSLRELHPEPFVRISSDDAAARGIVEGDIVKIHNDRGYVVCRAAIDAGVRPSVLIMDHGWQKWDFIEGHYADLSGTYTGARWAGISFYDNLCDIEKVQ